MLFIIMIVLGALLSYFLPWWAVAPLLFVLSWWKAKTASEAAKTAGLAMCILWLVYANVLNATADVNMIEKVGNIFTGDTGPLSKVPKAIVMNLAVTIISLALGSMSGLAGVKARQYFEHK